MLERDCACTHPQVNNTIIETRLKENPVELCFGRLRLCFRSIRVVNREGKTGIEARDEVELSIPNKNKKRNDMMHSACLVNVNLDVTDTSALDGLVDFGDNTLNEDDALCGKAGRPLDHLL